MASDEIVFLPASGLAEAIRTRRISAGEVMDSHLEHISTHNHQLNAIVTIDEDQCVRRAKEADDSLARGEIWGPLHGVPVTLKDSFETADLRTTSGYGPLSHYVPRQDATVVARLRSAGAIVLGKTNMSELAKDAQSNNSLFGRTNNPWNLQYTPGGSSGGSAAAVASGMSPLDVGSDFGGSIRIPAHFCGVFGLKPTEHRVSSAGHIPDLPGVPRGIRHINVYGPIARSIEDLRLCLSLISGPDDRDWEVPPVPLGTPPQRSLRHLRFAWTDDFGGIPVTAEIRRSLEQLAQTLINYGCHVERSSPRDFNFELAWRTYGEIVGMETGAMSPLLQRMATYISGPFVFRKEPIHRGMASAAGLKFKRYVLALARRDEFISQIESFLDSYDAWLCPVSSRPAFKHRSPVTLNRPGEPIDVDGHDVPYWIGTVAYTSIFSLTGAPVVVLPLTQSREGLPIGVQLAGRRWSDMQLLETAGKLLQIATGYQRPPGY